MRLGSRFPGAEWYRFGCEGENAHRGLLSAQKIFLLENAEPQSWDLKSCQDALIAVADADQTTEMFAIHHLHCADAATPIYCAIGSTLTL